MRAFDVGTLDSMTAWVSSKILGDTAANVRRYYMRYVSEMPIDCFLCVCQEPAITRFYLPSSDERIQHFHVCARTLICQGRKAAHDLVNIFVSVASVFCALACWSTPTGTRISADVV